ncbi:MAG: 4'-phosphopantetheinyl transferase superfamily protein [Gammaproteobacteria bacterium]|nr:4'-phosphopantetheinyl transferase superfamily protein [Gammaproteobacteria bacterium]
MQTKCLDGIAPLQIGDEVLPHTCLVLSRVGDHVDQLLNPENQAIQNSIASRKREFSSGRRAAHTALRQIGIEGVPIDRTGRMPNWPSGIVGSISHSNALAVATIGPDDEYVGIGIDVIPVLAVSESVGGRVLLDAERQWLSQMDSGTWRTALYSAKESIYKAVNPIVGEFLAFDDVELRVSLESLEFSANTTRARESSNTVKRGKGYFHRIEGHWLTIFAVSRTEDSKES